MASTIEVSEDETYNFIVRECSKRLVNDGYGREARLEVWIDVRNNDKHISSNEEMYGWLLPLLLVTSLVMVYMLFRDK